ncbi:TD and POZ domain-containing protein 4 [Argiope bruennichi]|uniref:TD and POZ domain-containing protein 4 n=1 Tax=Argiope bruennichi TaxID=94029 RepID=A0A8T0EPA1_ARGBR|nr:TD and POZ domain-containing protein 4 [Argiope bruennichi]
MLSEYEDKEKQTLSEACDDRISCHSTFLEDLKCLYQSQIVSDIKIKTTCTTFSAHKIVLSSLSSKFKEMFTTDLKDKPTDFIEIKDLDDDIVLRMLLFFYTESLDDVQWDMAMKLYHAADVYQIQRLKFKCSSFLLENLIVSNVGDLLLLAHDHHDNKLKSVVADYICIYDEEIFNSDEWAAFSEAYFQLAFETMRIKYKKNKKFLVSNPY